jgi:hypothetical protein
LRFFAFCRSRQPEYRPFSHSLSIFKDLAYAVGIIGRISAGGALS